MDATEANESSATTALDAAALIFAMLFPTAMTWIYFVALGSSDGRLGPWQSIAYAVGKIVQFGFPLLYAVWRDPRHIGRPRFTRGGWAIAISFGVATALAMAALYSGWLRTSPFLGDAPQRVREKVAGFGITTLPAFLAFAVFLSAIHSMLEEYYWRWFVFGELRRRIANSWALAFSSIGFMLHHVVVLGVYFPERFWSLAMPFSLGVAVGGAVWAWVYQRSGSLLPSWASHAIVDAAIMAIGWDLLSLAS